MKRTESLKGCLRRFASVRVLCVGDMMLDSFVYGDVDRISPEAPVPVFRWRSEKEALGGVGNVAANLRALGVGVSLVCRVGDDQSGARVRELLAESGVALTASVRADVPTIRKVRFVSMNSHLLRMDRETVVWPDEAEGESVAKAVASALDGGVNLVLLSDYAKGLLSPALCARIIAMCREKGVPVFVDPKGTDYSKYAGATLVKPNRRELEAALGEKVDLSQPDFADRVASAARRLAEKAGLVDVMVTLSERGMVYAPADGSQAIHLATESREVSDVSGAGDTTIATLAAATAAGASVRDAMALANVAAGIVVGKVGTAVVTPEEILRNLLRKEASGMPFESKVLGRGEAAAQVANWREAGLRVGFTNGCFDCLHCGHLSSLYQAKAYCDRLVVAINTDASVRRLKGPTRPIQDERTRALVLAGLELVDAVVLFDEDTALDVVRELRPDVIAKEGYAIENWPEAQFVVSYGGEAAVLERVDGYSTSEMVKRMEARK